MPEMNGDQMTAVIKEASPHTPVLLVTGFADMPMDGVRPTHPPDLVLRKPITQMVLRQAIAQILSATPVHGQTGQVLVGGDRMEHKLLL
jgi:CheY-like chemotaxis protein